MSIREELWPPCRRALPVVWPVGEREERVAAVVAEGPCRTMLLPPAVRLWLEANQAELALKLYRHLLAGVFRPKRTLRISRPPLSGHTPTTPALGDLERRKQQTEEQ